MSIPFLCAPIISIPIHKGTGIDSSTTYSIQNHPLFIIFTKPRLIALSVVVLNTHKYLISLNYRYYGYQHTNNFIIDENLKRMSLILFIDISFSKAVGKYPFHVIIHTKKFKELLLTQPSFSL